MAFPKLSNGRVDQQLTNILQAYTNDDFIADMILPTVPGLKEESGKIATLGNSHLRVYSSKRALYDESGHRIEWTITNDDSYQIEYYDLEGYVPQRLQDQLQLPFNARRDIGLTLVQALMLERETALSDTITNTAVITNNTTLSGTSKFSDYDNSDPRSVIETGRDTIFAATGKEANSMAIGRGVFNTLKGHPFFVNMVKGIRVLDGNSLMTLMKDFFEIDNIYIGKGIYVNTNEGQTETKTNLSWNDDIVLFHKPKGPSLLAPSFGYSFKLAGQNTRASVRRHQNDIGDIIKYETAYQDKILDVNAGYLIKSAI